MTATATKKKKKQVKKPAGPLTFKQLLGRVMNHEKFATLLKTARETGWLTHPEFLTRMSEQETEIVKEAYRKDGHAKRAKVADLSRSLPETVGPIVDDKSTKVTKRFVTLSGGGQTVTVDANLFLTMKRRHPGASLYLAKPDGALGVIFSDKQDTVAVLPLQDDDGNDEDTKTD